MTSPSSPRYTHDIGSGKGDLAGVGAVSYTTPRAGWQAGRAYGSGLPTPLQNEVLSDEAFCHHAGVQ